MKEEITSAEVGIVNEGENEKDTHRTSVQIVRAPHGLRFTTQDALSIRHCVAVVNELKL